MVTKVAPSVTRQTTAATAADQQPTKFSLKDLGELRLLKTGVQGQESRAMTAQAQQLLVKAGVLEDGQFQPGEFDPATEQAVTQWQQSKHLTVDGVIGQETWGSFYGLKVAPGADRLKGQGAAEGWGSSPAAPGRQQGGKSTGAPKADTRRPDVTPRAPQLDPAAKAPSTAQTPAAPEAPAAAPEAPAAQPPAAEPPAAQPPAAQTPVAQPPVAQPPVAQPPAPAAPAAKPGSVASPPSPDAPTGPTQATAGGKATRTLEGSDQPVLGLDGKPLEATDAEWERAVALPNGRAVVLNPGEQLLAGNDQLPISQNGRLVVFDQNQQPVRLLNPDAPATQPGVQDSDMAQVAADAKALSSSSNGKGVGGALAQVYVATKFRNIKVQAGHEPAAKAARETAHEAAQSASSLAGKAGAAARTAKKADAALEAAKVAAVGKPATSAEAAALTRAEAEAVKANKVLEEARAAAQVANKAARAEAATAGKAEKLLEQTPGLLSRGYSAATSVLGFASKWTGLNALGRLGVNVGARIGLNAVLSKHSAQVVELAGKVAARIAESAAGRAGKVGLEFGARLLKNLSGRIATTLPYAGVVVSGTFAYVDGKHLLEVRNDPNAPMGKLALASVSAGASALATIGHAAEVVPVLGNLVSSGTAFVTSLVSAASSAAEVALYP